MGDWRTIAVGVAEIVMYIVLTTGIFQNLIQIVQLIIAGNALRDRPPVVDAKELLTRYSDVAPAITVIAPAFNESATITSSIQSMLGLRYPRFDIIIVNDGSTDDTLAILTREYALAPDPRPFDPVLAHQPVTAIYRSTIHPQLVVMDKINGGKADAQNAAVNLSTNPLFLIVDGDTLLEPDALIRSAQSFMDDPVRTIAIGGALRIANGSRMRDGRVREVDLPAKLLPRIQIVEYLRSFLMARHAMAKVNCLMIISGAFGLFRKDVVVAIGGYTSGSMGEDLDIVIRLHRYMRDSGADYRIGFVPEPMCWTEVPETLKILGGQRARWQNGALDCFFRYRHMVLNPNYGRIGIFGFGQMLIVDVIGPIVEVLGYFTIPLFYFLGALSWASLIVYIAVVFALGVFVSIASFILAEMQLRPYPRPIHLAELGAAAIIENFGYRQLHNFWRLRGYWSYLRGQHTWGEMPRMGFEEAAAGRTAT